MQTLRLCVFLAFITALRAYELSRNMAEFYCIVNGNATNLEQVKEEGANRTLIHIGRQPVLAPALSQVPVIHLVEYMSGAVFRALILNVTEGADGIIYTDPYNIIGNKNIKPETLDSNQIKSLTRNDLHGQKDCKASYTRIKPFIFLMNWPDCKRAPVNGQRESYVATLTCDEATATFPAGAQEKSTLVPYRIKQQGHRYPLENAPYYYACNCDKRCDKTSD